MIDWKIILIAVIVVVLIITLVACSCKPGNTGNSSSNVGSGSSAVASGGTSSAVTELTADQKDTVKLYEAAVKKRDTYLACEIKRTFTEGDKTIDTTLTYYTPYGMGTFYFYKLATVNGEVYVEERYNGTYTIKSPSKTDTQGTSGFMSNIITKLKDGDESHVRMTMYADFEYSKMTATDASIDTSDSEVQKIEVKYDRADKGTVLKEFGGEDKYYAENIVVKAEIDYDNDHLLREELSFVLVNRETGEKMNCSAVTTLDKIEGISELPN